jgi:hypothetical protein
MAKDKSQQEPERESLVKDAESQGVPRPVAEEIVDEVIEEDVAPEKQKEVIEESVQIENEDQTPTGGRRREG